MENSTRKVVLALIEYEGQFLLILRKKPQMKLAWAFPGGMVEKGETEENAVVREAKEEVGLEVKVVKKLLERKHPNTFVQIVYFHCEPIGDNAEPKVLEEYEISEAKWVPASEVTTYFTSDIHPTILDFLAKHK